MKIANYKCIAIETGRFALDGGAMFGVVPKALWERSNPADEKNRIELALRCLLLKSDNRIILIDSGIGQNWDEKFNYIYKVDHTQHTLVKSLNDHHLNVEDITDVILTHLHFDHAGGCTFQKNGRWQVTFPNATHHVQVEQWEWAMHPVEKDRASFVNERLEILQKTKQLNLLNAPGQLFEGVELLVMYGHTQGMQLVKVSDINNTLLFCADLIPTATHIPIPWVMGYDNHPLTTIAEKQRLLPEAAANNWYLFFEHDPFQVVTTVQKTDKGFSMGEKVDLL